MKNKTLTLAILFLFFSFLMLVFSFWTRFAHWETYYFFLGAGLAVFFIFVAIGIFLTQNNSTK